MKIRTTNIENGKKIIIPLCPASFFNNDSLNLTVNWGDGSATETITSFSTSDQVKDSRKNVIANLLSHTYTTGGHKIITITGGFGGKLAFMQTTRQNGNNVQNMKAPGTRFCFFRIFECNVGTQFYIHGQGDFRGFSRLRAIDKNILPLTSVNPASEIKLNTSAGSKMLMNKTFCQCKLIRFFGGFKPTSTESMQNTFEGCKKLDKGWIINSWDVSQTKKFNAAFKDTELKVRMWKWLHEGNDDYIAEDMSQMFENTIFNWDKGINSWDMTTVKNTSRMFKNSNFDFPVTQWFRSGDENFIIENMSGMFEGSTFSKDLSAWDVSTVTNLSAMFKDTEYDKDISTWEINENVNSHDFFANNYVLTDDKIPEALRTTTTTPSPVETIQSGNVPASSNGEGYIGERAYNSGNFYVATQENSWQRTALTSVTRSTGLLGEIDYTQDYYYINIDGDTSWGQTPLVETSYSREGSVGDTGVALNYYYLNTSGGWRQIGLASW